jgi:uncharacterized protein YjeT (DUF2065 family)
MKAFLYAISLFWIISGAYFILYTEESRSILKKLLNLEEIYEKILSVMIIIIGLLILSSAPQIRHPWFIVFLGAIGLAKGLLFFFNPKNCFEKMRNWYLNTASDQTYRLFGIILLITGTAVLSWI